MRNMLLSILLLVVLGCRSGGSGDTFNSDTGNSGNSSAPVVCDCEIFPADNPWNTDISGYPLHPNSNGFITYILGGQNKFLHPDFGGGGAYGIPYLTVDTDQPRYQVIPEYADESDPDGNYGFNYPIPPDAPVENGSDAHVIVIEGSHCKLYEA